MTLLHAVLGFIIEANNLISIYMNRTGCPCIGSLFMRRHEYPGHLFLLCKYVKVEMKRGIKKLCLRT